MQMTPPLWQKCKRAKWLSDEALQIAQKKQYGELTKGLDLIDRVPDELWMEVLDIV